MMTEPYHAARESAQLDIRRARQLSLRVATLVGIWGTQHPITRAAVGRYWAASGMVPQNGHRLWSDDAFTTGYVREASAAGFGNRAARAAFGGERL